MYFVSLGLRVIVVLWVLGALLFHSWAMANDASASGKEGVGAKKSVSASTKSREAEEWLLRRNKDVILQSKDLSCGAASVAMLLNQQYGKSLTEEDALNAIGNDGTKKLSMLDLKKIGRHFDVTLVAAKVTLEFLKSFPQKSIVLLRSQPVSTKGDVLSAPVQQEQNYHYVLVVGFMRGKVHVRDPAYGNRYLTESEFVEAWAQIPGSPSKGYLVF